MKAFQTRRDFFGWTRGLLGAAGLASQTVSLKAAPASVDEGEDYYDKLGVAKIINAAGTYTMFTASIMPPSGAGGGGARGEDIPFACESCSSRPVNIWLSGCVVKAPW